MLLGVRLLVAAFRCGLSKESGCHCTDAPGGKTYRRLLTPLRSTSPFSDWRKAPDSRDDADGHPAQSGRGVAWQPATNCLYESYMNGCLGVRMGRSTEGTRAKGPFRAYPMEGYSALQGLSMAGFHMKSYTMIVIMIMIINISIIISIIIIRILLLLLLLISILLLLLLLLLLIAILLLLLALLLLLVLSILLLSLSLLSLSLS